MIAEYQNYLLNIRGFSEATATAYGKDLRAFATWAKANVEAASWSTITRDDIDRYITDLATQGLKPATTNRKLASISGLFNFMKRQGHDIENPCKYESRRKIAKTIPNTIPVCQLKCAYDNATGVTKTMIGLLATTGMRIQELLDLTWEDINFENASIRVRGKGNKQRIVYTTPSILTDLDNAKQATMPAGRMFYLQQREARYRIWEAMRPYSNACQLSPHAIRHTMATHMAASGANVTTIAAILGHDHIETTQKYIDMTAQDTRRVMQGNNIIA